MKILIIWQALSGTEQNFFWKNRQVYWKKDSAMVFKKMCQDIFGGLKLYWWKNEVLKFRDTVLLTSKQCYCWNVGCSVRGLHFSCMLFIKFVLFTSNQLCWESITYRTAINIVEIILWYQPLIYIVLYIIKVGWLTLK